MVGLYGLGGGCHGVTLITVMQVVCDCRSNVHNTLNEVEMQGTGIENDDVLEAWQAEGHCGEHIGRMEDANSSTRSGYR